MKQPGLSSRFFHVLPALLPALILAGAVSCGDPAVPAAERELGVFDLCLDGTPAQRVAWLMNAGYHSMALDGIDPGIINSYKEIPAVKSGEFKVLAALWWYNIKDPVDTASLDASLDGLAALGTALWPVADWNTQDWPDGQGGFDRSAAHAAALIHFETIALHCRQKGVNLVLYPHVGCLFEDAEEADIFRQGLAGRGYPEVRISLHLCHELKKGNRDRLGDIFARLKPWISLVSISGANTDTYTDTVNEYWSTAIMPLDRGSFDWRSFVTFVEASGWEGPVLLHTYGLPKTTSPDYDQHLERSLAAWKALPSIPSR